MGNGEKLEAFTLKSGTRKRCSLCTLLLNEVLYLKNRRTGDTNRRGRNQGIIICKWYDFVQKRSLNVFNKVAGYKIAAQNSITLLCTSKIHIGNEIQVKKNLIRSNLKKIGINLKKEVKDLYNEKFSQTNSSSHAFPQHAMFSFSSQKSCFK